MCSFVRPRSKQALVDGRVVVAVVVVVGVGGGNYGCGCSSGSRCGWLKLWL